MLDFAQEEAVCRIIKRLDSLGFFATHSILQEIANEVLKEPHDDPSTSPRTVSDMWSARFLKAHSKYFVRCSKVLVKDRGTVVI